MNEPPGVKLKRQNEKCKRRFLLFAFLYFNFALFFAACSIPNLESAECTEARQTVREFYSFHFGGEMRFSPENLRLRERFLTPEFAASLPDAPTEVDVFTVNSNDYPKAFRAGNCRAEAPDKAIFEVLLFWKTETRSEQRRIEVETVKRTDKWLINKIEYAK
ncbi:MAG TPA: hypothetical protein VF692_09600, partial [Pyrinomonadaceae bacterium]